MSDSIGKAIHSRLAGDATMNTLLSDSAGARKVFPIVAPQDVAFPFVVYRTVGLIATDAKEGASPVDFRTVQIDIYARTYSEVDNIKARVRALLDGYAGTIEGVNIQGCRMSGEEEADFEIENRGVFACSQDYRIRIVR